MHSLSCSSASINKCHTTCLQPMLLLQHTWNKCKSSRTSLELWKITSSLELWKILELENSWTITWGEFILQKGALLINILSLPVLYYHIQRRQTVMSASVLEHQFTVVQLLPYVFFLEKLWPEVWVSPRSRKPQRIQRNLLPQRNPREQRASLQPSSVPSTTPVRSGP